jgi:hypothetical protein
MEYSKEIIYDNITVPMSSPLYNDESHFGPIVTPDDFHLRADDTMNDNPNNNLSFDKSLVTPFEEDDDNETMERIFGIELIEFYHK